MLKKMKSFLICLLCCVVLTGCKDVIDLTEEQSTLIAEYAAGLLLKYDQNYEDRIVEGKREAGTMEEPAATEDTITEEETEEVKEEEKTKVDQKASAESEEPVVGTENDIAKIAGIEGVSITYKDYQVMDQYPATDNETEYVHLEADSGYKLLVVRFKITNTTEDIVDVSLLERAVEYKAVCNGDKAASPMLTILMDDLGTLETSVKPDEEQEAVLVFQISEGMKDALDTIELFVNYNDVRNVIKIK